MFVPVVRDLKSLRHLWWLACWTVTFAIILAVGHQSALAQVAPTTTLAGSVIDQSSAAIPGASVDLVNQNTQFTKHGLSDSQGRFLFNLVPPGTYTLKVTAKGFATFAQEGITLDVNTPANIPVNLSVGATAEQITVQANAAMVDTESGTLRQVVSEKYIDDLPLNGRNAATLVYMAPGTVTGKGQDRAGYAGTDDTIAVSVNGTYGNQVSYKLDGATHQDSITNLNATFPNPDALSEFSVETNNFDARYGGSAGAVVNIVTKSGSNTLHGSMFEYLRNGDLNARNFFCREAGRLKTESVRRLSRWPCFERSAFLFWLLSGYGNQ
jgi:hypothetical protein